LFYKNNILYGKMRPAMDSEKLTVLGFICIAVL